MSPFNLQDSRIVRGIAARLSDLAERLRAFARSSFGARVLRAMNWIFLGVVLLYLGFQLKEFGIAGIVQSLPRTPWFYVLFALLYVSLPMAELFIYRLCWPMSVRSSLGALFKKRVYNRDVMGYSGELYFFNWVQKNLGVDRARVAATVRDTNIISSLASTGVAVLLIGVFMVRGQVNVRLLIGNNTGYLIASLTVAVILVLLAIRFRRYVFSMSRGLAGKVMLIYTARLLIGQVLQIGQWAVVLPDQPLRVWFTFAALAIIVNRLPFISNQNLVFMGAGMSIVSQLGLPAVEVAAMLLATTVLDKFVNVAAFATASYSERHQIGLSVPLSDGSDQIESDLADPPRTDHFVPDRV